ncbi:MULTISPECIES: RluA family pseudouridine synthase [Actinoalloteichus]|uniref:RNA pseudouridylate synthase n=1 Tax=Actinoalloteichus fjordicus TaxID=1612552 RepID=A0AAC9PSM4_9PSEU|nr:MULTISPECIES: RluA family pseudouridine synthase [Actinoalloteichus]APU15709.1 23S RNA-specific pseudouridylate synthase [Actinoalloteichus fjordicus]APU21769.1 23S RNA-specific pseudouridylate synthase [Actinoalloteichus sp. GBA129-24]
MRRKLASPLPQRNGLDPARLKLPAEGPWATIRDHLVERLPMVAPARIDAMLAGREIVGLDGPVAPDAPYRPDSFVWFHRDLPDEVPVPFDIRVLHRDDDLVVVDKPHFLATIPRGRHVLETALVRLRRELDLPALSPAHRLDRVTAGLVMFVVRRERRGAYQTMFRDRRVHKEYEAIAPVDPALDLPRTVRSRIVKERGIITAQEVDGPPNSESRVELLEERDGLGRYRLQPRTGRTHQLRLHMSGLGVPILGDDFYPTLVETALDDFRRPLQLLATTLEFTDPISGEPRRFESRASLLAWTSYAEWAGRV